MPLDPIPTYPSQHDPTGATNNPPGDDRRAQGDEQFRIMKANLNQTLPNISGPITVTQDEINTLDQINTGSTIETRLKNFEDAFPAGTKMLFAQASLPAGFQVPVGGDHSDRMLRVVANSTTGGSEAGTDNPILNDKTPTHNHPGSTAGAGGHSHSLYSATATPGVDIGIDQNVFDINIIRGNNQAGYVISVADHTHTVTVSNNVGGSNWTPKYVDVIVGEKT